MKRATASLIDLRWRDGDGMIISAAVWTQAGLSKKNWNNPELPFFMIGKKWSS